MKWNQKYRPKNIDGYIGNTRTKTNINKLISIGKLPQTILLSGERGTGKTSLARLISKSLLCENLSESGVACEECTTCQQMNGYLESGSAPRNLGITEIDITEMNRREDATNIVERMKARSLASGKRIFILDEIQRATPEAQSSFLKIAEEPPENLYIFLCTTNPEDLLVPLKSRFHTFSIKRPSRTELSRHLEYICTEEGVNFESKALAKLSDIHKYNPRETINKLEYLGTLGTITMKNIEEEYSIIGNDIYDSFLQHTFEGNLLEVTRIIVNFEQNGDSNGLEFIEGVGTYLAELLKIKSGVHLDYTHSELSQYRNRIKSYEDETLIAYLKIVNKYTEQRNDNLYSLMSLGAELIEVTQKEHIVEVEKVQEHIEERERAVNYAKVSKEVEKKKPVQKPTLASEDDLLEIFGNSIKQVDFNSVRKKENTNE